MFISIIVPIYKVEPFITKCLESCIGQKDVVLGKDYEIIAIDDGSPDKSGDMAEQLLSNKKGCRILRQVNKGLSEARNAGLAIAQGLYVWYVDSDDWINQDGISQLIDISEKFELPDIIMIRSQIETPTGTGNIWHNQWRNESCVKTGLDVLCEDDWLTPAQFYVVKREFVLKYNIRFKAGILHEDNHYTPRLLYYAKRVKQTNKVLYHSYINSDSITKTSNPKRSYDLLTTCQDLSAFANANHISGRTERAWNKFISITLNHSLELINDHSYEIRADFNMKLYRCKDLFYRMRHSGSLKHIVEGCIFGLVKNYTLLYRIFKA